MKIIEGDFGKKKDEIPKASDVAQSIADWASEQEDEENVHIAIVAVLYIEGVSLAIVGNETTVDSAHMLLSMGASDLMRQTLGD